MSDITPILQSLDNCRTDTDLTALNTALKQRKADHTAEDWQRIINQGKAVRARLARPEHPPERTYPLLLPDPYTVAYMLAHPSPKRIDRS